MKSKSPNKVPPLTLRLATILIFYLISGGLYFLINKLNEGKPAYTLGITLDSCIPFVPFWAWFYVLYFVVIVTPFFFINDYRELKLSIISYSIAATITLCFYFFWRTYMIRPEVIGNGVSEWLVKMIYRADNPYNCFPSQHVTFSWLAAMVARRKNKVFGGIWVVLALLISLSTLFIKQHWFMDLLSGIITAIVAYLLVFEIFGHKKSNRVEKFSN